MRGALVEPDAITLRPNVIDSRGRQPFLMGKKQKKHTSEVVSEDEVDTTANNARLSKVSMKNPRTTNCRSEGNPYVLLAKAGSGRSDNQMTKEDGWESVP